MAVEASIADKLSMLWNLQQIDSQLDELQILKGELPMEVADLEDEVAGLDTRIKKLKATLKESEQDISRMQVTAKESDANIKKYQKQLEEVKNNREYEALQKEIELAKLDIQLSEKRVREAKAAPRTHAARLAAMGAGQGFRHVVEEEADRHVQHPRQVEQPRGAHPVHAALVFLHLLEGQAQRLAQPLLRQAHQGAAQADAAADMGIDGAGSRLTLGSPDRRLVLVPDRSRHRASILSFRARARV